MAGNNLILAGDIGGTKTHLALFSLQGEKLQSEIKKTFPSKQFSGLEPVVEEFLAGSPGFNQPRLFRYCRPRGGGPSQNAQPAMGGERRENYANVQSELRRSAQ